MTFDELYDEYVTLSKEILDATSRRWTNYYEQSEEEILLRRLELRYKVIDNIMFCLNSGLDDNKKQKLLDDIFPPKE